MSEIPLQVAWGALWGALLALKTAALQGRLTFGEFFQGD
jgi:hypothetical protein